jgi:hypothetical protein
MQPFKCSFLIYSSTFSSVSVKSWAAIVNSAQCMPCMQTGSHVLCNAIIPCKDEANSDHEQAKLFKGI